MHHALAGRGKFGTILTKEEEKFRSLSSSKYRKKSFHPHLGEGKRTSDQGDCRIISSYVSDLVGQEYFHKLRFQRKAVLEKKEPQKKLSLSKKKKKGWENIERVCVPAGRTSVGTVPITILRTEKINTRSGLLEEGGRTNVRAHRRKR